MDKKPAVILLVDDDEVLRKVYQMQFESYPEYRLITADNIKTAAEMAEKNPPDLILLDLILGRKPGTPLAECNKAEGFNFLIYLKLDKRLKDIPVIVFSNLDSPKDIDQAMNSGASDYAVKAKTLPSELIERVRDVLQLSRAKSKVRRLNKITK